MTTTTTTEKSSIETPEELLASLRSIREQLKNDLDAYAGLGFSPLKWAQVRHWASTLPPSEDWLINRKHDLRTLLGWIITALLCALVLPSVKTYSNRYSA